MAKKRKDARTLVSASGNPARVQQVQGLRRSNAAGLHVHRKTRGAMRRAAIRESAGND